MNFLSNMSKRNTLVGLDVGTCNVRAVVAELREDNDKLQIIGTGISLASGMLRGSVNDVEEVAKSIKSAVLEAERTSGISIDSAIVSFGNNQIVCRNARGVVAVSRADYEISEDDINRVTNTAQAVSLPPNREIIHIIPKQYIIDGQEKVKDPRGMNGVRLELEAMIIEASSPNIKNLNKCLGIAGLDNNAIVFSALAASDAVLSKRQKELGVLLLDIGGGTTSMIVFEEGGIIHAGSLPIGGNHITNDIAIGLRTSIDVAERVKIEYGSVLPNDIGKKEGIDLSKLEGEEGVVSRRQIAEIMEARVEEIFNMVNKELKKIERQGLLPGGVVLCGGSAKIPGMVDLAKKRLGLPAQIGFPLEVDGIIDRVDDPAFATAVGLVLHGMSAHDSYKSQSQFTRNNIDQSVKKFFNLIKKFKP